MRNNHGGGHNPIRQGYNQAVYKMIQLFGALTMLYIGAQIVANLIAPVWGWMLVIAVILLVVWFVRKRIRRL
jgi:hypothetical protein